MRALIEVLRGIVREAAEQLGEETVWPGQETVVGDARGVLSLLKTVLATAVGRFAGKRVHEGGVAIKGLPAGAEVAWTGRIDPIAEELRLVARAAQRKKYGPFYWTLAVERGGKPVAEKTFGPTTDIERQGAKWLANAVREMALDADGKGQP